MEMQRRSVEGSLGLCKVLGDFVPMGFRASVCIYLLNTNCLQDGKRIGVPSVVVLGILGGVLDVRANGAGVGLEARRRFCPPCGVGQWLSAGTNTISLRNPYRMLRTDLAVAALFLSGHPTPGPRRYRGKVSRFCGLRV